MAGLGLPAQPSGMIGLGIPARSSKAITDAEQRGHRRRAEREGELESDDPRTCKASEARATGESMTARVKPRPSRPVVKHARRIINRKAQGKRTYSSKHSRVRTWSRRGNTSRPTREVLVLTG